MQITKNSVETAIGPSDWFTGAVYIDAVAAPPAPNRAQAKLVHFTPARAPPGTPTRSGKRSTSPRGSASANAKAAPSRSSAPATVCSSSPARTTGTAPPQTASWSTSRSKRPTTPATPPPGANTSPTRNTRPLRCHSRHPNRTRRSHCQRERQSPHCSTTPLLQTVGVAKSLLRVMGERQRCPWRSGFAGLVESLCDPDVVLDRLGGQVMFVELQQAVSRGD